MPPASRPGGRSASSAPPQARDNARAVANRCCCTGWLSAFGCRWGTSSFGCAAWRRGCAASGRRILRNRRLLLRLLLARTHQKDQHRSKSQENNERSPLTRLHHDASFPRARLAPARFTPGTHREGKSAHITIELETLRRRGTPAFRLHDYNTTCARMQGKSAQRLFNRRLVAGQRVPVHTPQLCDGGVTKLSRRAWCP